MTKESSPKKYDFFEDFDQTPIIEWFSENKRKILGGLGIFFVTLLVLYYIFSQKAIQTEGDFLSAEVAFQHVQENKDFAENLTLLDSLLISYPELHAKYDGPLAQILLIKNEAVKAAPYAERVFKRVKGDGLDYYEEYGKNSILIQQGDYKTAYENAKTLRTEMDQLTAMDHGDLLYGYNLIRLAVLEQVLEYQKEELATWDQLQKFTAFSEINQLFTDGRISLQDYIISRKQALKQ
jgi:hypothetical protein